MRKIAVVFSLAALLLAGCSIFNPGDDYYIYFAHEDTDAAAHEAYPIYVMDTDGENMEVAVFGTETVYCDQGIRLDTAAGWMTYAYAGPGEEYQLAVQKTDGSFRFIHREQITAQMPAISADGEKVVFIETLQGGFHQYMCIINTDSTGLVKYPFNPEDTVLQDWPSFSPDGQNIVYCQYTTDLTHKHIYTVDAEFTLMLPVTDADATDAYPVFSPDGEQILFASNRSGVNQIYVMNNDGTELVQLTEEGNNYQPCFSPDGKKIAFVSDRDGNAEIYIMKSDGSKQERLTENSVEDLWPVFGSQRFPEPVE